MSVTEDIQIKKIVLRLAQAEEQVLAAMQMIEQNRSWTDVLDQIDGAACLLSEATGLMTDGMDQSLRL